MRPLFARLHTALAWVIFLGGIVVIYLIAQSVFGGGSPANHGAFGRILFLISLKLLIASLVCRSSRLNVGLSLLVPVLLFAQGMFVYVPAFAPAVRALHGVNGIVIMGICYVLAAGRARAVAPAGHPAIAPERSAATP
jgi:hypothetical protein